jgi:hypothetical protein
MSFFEDASLVLIPSAIKDEKVYSVKPTDGTGDLTFSRASDATRVASNGLIEKVRTNEILYSQDFSNAEWSAAVGITLTHGQTDPNGGTTATKVEFSASGQAFEQEIGGLSTSTLYSFSIWVRCDSGTISFEMGNLNALSFETKTATTTWQRFSITQTPSATTRYPRFVQGTAASTLYIAFAQLEVSDFGATPYIPTTTTAVSVGPVSGLPRLDYLNSSCPRLLLEPSSTTLLTFSEQLDNAAWDKTSGGAAITANSVTSPDGYTNADTITGTGAGVAFVLVRQTISVAAAGTYTFSGFFKYNNHPFVSLNLSAYDGGGNANYNIQTGVVTNVSAGSTAKIENYGNGWYRCSLTSAIGATDLTGRPSIYVAYDGTTSDFPTTGDAAGKAVYAWGFNMCLGSYVQSYLPTLSTSVTRVADAASKTGISSLIGQTEGTLFMDIDPQDISALGRYISIEASAGIGSGWIGIFAEGTTPNTLRFYGDGFDFDAGLAPRGVRIKAALAYKNGVLTSAYVNGASVGTLTADTTGKSYANLKLSSAVIGNAGCANYYQALIFPTALTPAQLAELTA